MRPRMGTRMDGRRFATFVVATVLVSCGSSSSGKGGGRDASTGNGTGGTSSNGGAPSTGGSSNGGNSSNTGGSSGKGSGGAGTAGTGGSAGASGCAADPLHTGETPPNGDDEFDCAILAATEKYG